MPPRPPALVAALALLLPLAARADGPRPAPARVNNLKVLSSQNDDVTTIDNIVASFARPGMTDQERARALWTAAIKYRHQAPPPDEGLAADWEAHDPVKVFNVYGYCMCCCSSAILEALNRADGREARGRILNGHSVPEVKFGDAWHLYDASLITYFPRPADGVDASVDEVRDAVGKWYEQNPGYKGDPSKLSSLMRRDGWTGWKADGPPLLAACPFLNLGFFPAGTHGWDATMSEYARTPSEVYDYGYHDGHRALFALRPGESLVREAGNRGLHINDDRHSDWDGPKARAPEGDLKYLNTFLPGYRGGLVGNGVHRYAPDLASGEILAGGESAENLASGGTPALHLAAGGRPGVLVLPMSSPYVYLGGRLKLTASRKSATDRVAVSVSTNGGRTFAPLWSADAIGTSEASIDLSVPIRRRYAFWLKVELESATPDGAGLEALAVEADFQHAPRTLPWLTKGPNTITVAADADPTLATRTIAGRITPDANFTRNETSTSLGFHFENLNVQDGAAWWKGGTGRLTVPIATPGDLVALRWSLQARARGDRDAIAMQISTDAGRTWRDAARFAGPTPGRTESYRAGDFPPGTRRALLRFELTGKDTIGVQNLRIDADHRDPLAAANGFRPFRVVHRWTEAGRERTHAQEVTALPFRYTIDAAGDPQMTSVTYEMPSGR
jgi:hypothetical protein